MFGRRSTFDNPGTTRDHEKQKIAAQRGFAAGGNQDLTFGTSFLLACWRQTLSDEFRIAVKSSVNDFFNELRSLSNLELGRAPPLDMPLLATPPDQRLTPGLLSGRTAHLSKSPAAFAFLASVRCTPRDAKICKNQPSTPGRPEARRPASLVTLALSHGS